MASLKCLACGHDNKVGDESCTSCSSSLNLRLCSACEAINANSAERCHSCGAQFDAKAEAAASVVVEATQEAPASEEKVLPAAWLAGAEDATRHGRRAAAALWLLPILAVTSFAYYFYGASQAAPKPAAAPAARAGVAQATPVTPAAEVVRATTAPVRATTAPVDPGKTAFEPKRTLTPVTHTRGESAAIPVKAIPAAAPAVATAPPAPNEPAPVALERRPRVTHTKAEPSEAAEAGAVGASVPSAAVKLEPAACAPGVAALGLCKTK